MFSTTLPSLPYSRFGYGIIGLWVFWLLLYFVVFGCITSAVARKKGRNGTGWFFMGGLLGPVSLIIALVMPPAEYYEYWRGMAARRDPSSAGTGTGSTGDPSSSTRS